MTANDNHQTFTVPELAQRWKCDRRSILEAIAENRLHAFRIGKRVWRISLEEVLRFESDRKVS